MNERVTLETLVYIEEYQKLTGETSELLSDVKPRLFHIKNAIENIFEFRCPDEYLSVLTNELLNCTH